MASGRLLEGSAVIGAPPFRGRFRGGVSGGGGGGGGGGWGVARAGGRDSSLHTPLAFDDGSEDEF